MPIRKLPLLVLLAAPAQAQVPDLPPNVRLTHDCADLVDPKQAQECRMLHPDSTTRAPGGGRTAAPQPERRTYTLEPAPSPTR